MAVPGRICFLGSPWPAGHGLETLEWTGRLDPERGLFFDLHLVSVDYESENEPAFDDEDSDWEAVACWGNYHRCTLSSTFWPDLNTEGIWVADDNDPLDFGRLADWKFEVDGSTRVEDDDEHSFHIYLLGHDTALRHTIHFDHRRGRTFSLRWTAKIALSYAGQTELAHALVVESPSLTFEGFRIPEGLSASQARAALARFITGPVQYELRAGVLRPKAGPLR